MGHPGFRWQREIDCESDMSIGDLLEVLMALSLAATDLGRPGCVCRAAVMLYWGRGEVQPKSAVHETGIMQSF